MAIMFGNGQVNTLTKGNSTLMMKTEEFVATATTLPVAGTSSAGWNHQYEGPDGKLYEKKNPKFYDAEGKEIKTGSTLTVGDRYFCSYDLAIANGYLIDISSNSFPGTYFVTCDTYVRSQESGKDELIWNSSLVA